jgi:uncharacterized protein YecT (DUF1311 family)
MRVLAMIMALLAVLALPAHAQMGSGKRGQRSNEDTKQAADKQKKAKVDEKAYQDALKRIPDPKEKYDPWGVTKTPDANKKPAK